MDHKRRHPQRQDLFAVGRQVALDNGNTRVREYVQHPGGVAIVPVVDHSVILIRQFRIAIGREKDEEPIRCVERELEEEIGYRAQKLIPVATYFSSVGFADERMHLFLALGLEKTKLKLEDDERIREVIMPMEMIEKNLAAQVFEDAKTIIGLRELLAFLEKTKKQ